MSLYDVTMPMFGMTDCCSFGLVYARGGHDVREVGAGQLAARRLDELSLARAFEIFAARRGGAATDAFGDFDDDVVELLGGHASIHTSYGRVAR